VDAVNKAKQIIDSKQTFSEFKAEIDRLLTKQEYDRAIEKIKQKKIKK
jgi:hypothetical protein